jgi:hypothetical protein
MRRTNSTVLTFTFLFLQFLAGQEERWLPAPYNSSTLSGRIPFIAMAGATVSPKRLNGGDDVTTWSQAQVERDPSQFQSWAKYWPNRPNQTAVFGPGVYPLTTIWRIGHSGTRIIGAGPGKTVFSWNTALSDIYSMNADLAAPNEEWSFRGGLLWVERDPLTPLENLSEPLRITAEVAEGSSEVPIDSSMISNAETLVGHVVTIRWEGDDEFYKLLWGHDASAEQVQWSQWPAIHNGRLRLESQVTIKGLSGANLLLDRPLRLPIKSSWNVTLGRRTGEVERVELSGFTLTFPKHRPEAHLKEKGFNGIFMYGSSDALIQAIATDQADSAVILEKCHAITVTGLAMAGDSDFRMHHGVSLRKFTNDCLIEDFEISVPVQHGISVQDLAHGNVFRKGRMHHGTFDSHRGLPFDNVRTDIVLNGGGLGGGAIGPLQGRRMVNWNVLVDLPKDTTEDAGTTTSASSAAVLGLKTKRKRTSKRALGHDQVINPEYFVMSALVGVRGLPMPQPAPLDKGLWAMPNGDKGTIVLDYGSIPVPPDLFSAQQTWWLDRMKSQPR